MTSINKMETQGQKHLLINIMLATAASSAVIAMVMTPFDMVFFKMMAKTANMSSRSSFMQIAKDIFVTNRQSMGSTNALGLAMAATFIRYFFVLTSVNACINTTKKSN